MTSAKIISYTGARHDVTGMLSRKPRRSLDIGCSNGALSRVLVDDGVETWGIEIDPVFAAQAAGRLAVVLVGDAMEQTASSMR